MRSVSWPTFVRTATCFASTITPTDRPLRLVALCGSLRAASSNRALLEATAELAPEDFAVAQFTPASLPHFNADLEAADLPDPVQAWRLTVARCDGMLLSCPEYAAGLPGAFKNALDWLVGEPGFFRKPVAIHNASQRSVHAQKALRLVLRTMSADIVRGSVPDPATPWRNAAAGRPRPQPWYDNGDQSGACRHESSHTINVAGNVKYCI